MDVVIMIFYLHVRPFLKSYIEKIFIKLFVSQAKEAEAKSSKPKKISDVLAIDKNKDKKKKVIGAGPGGAAVGAAAGGTVDAKAKRKEELLKQLKAVEEAISRKRTKLEK